ncbi:hypothetical protein PQX77_002737 [Marasmius sp. AFHP31]|nr:hypothetical protein PQX77_002737 [Marasmius sp. AFHP31]
MSSASITFNDSVTLSPQAMAFINYFHPEFHLKSDYSFLSQSFLDLINESDAPRPPDLIDTFIHISDVPGEVTCFQKRLDVSELDLQLKSRKNPDPQYCNVREVKAGVEETGFNLEHWIGSNGWVETTVGFAYVSENKHDFSISFDYCVGVFVQMADEFISVPINIRVWRRDVFLTMRELSLYVASPTVNHIPIRYSKHSSPLGSKMFKTFANRFSWDGELLTEKRTGLVVRMAQGARKFRMVVEEMWMDEYWRQRWSTFTPESLARQVMVMADEWILDAEVYAEYWLTNAARRLFL